MITHFAELELYTVSIQNIRQFYHSTVKFPIISESNDRISFKPTEHFTLTFIEIYKPISPAHIAFEVPQSEFDFVILFLRSAQIQLLEWADGRVTDHFETGENAYFRDCDGNLLEIISHNYIKENVLAPAGELRILYLREVGFPVESVVSFREWLVSNLAVKTAKKYDNFSFAIGGTAHLVINSTQRRWIPIAMMALPPMMNIVFGVTDSEFLNAVHSKLHQDELIHRSETELQFIKDGYNFTLRITDFNKEIPRLLNLPYSITD